MIRSTDMVIGGLTKPKCPGVLCSLRCYELGKLCCADISCKLILKLDPVSMQPSRMQLPTVCLSRNDACVKFWLRSHCNGMAA